MSGKRKGQCPYQHLGLKLPTYDPWILLQMDPEELKRQIRQLDESQEWVLLGKMVPRMRHPGDLLPRG